MALEICAPSFNFGGKLREAADQINYASRRKGSHIANCQGNAKATCDSSREELKNVNKADETLVCVLIKYTVILRRGEKNFIAF